MKTYYPYPQIPIYDHFCKNLLLILFLFLIIEIDMSIKHKFCHYKALTKAKPTRKNEVNVC